MKIQYLPPFLFTYFFYSFLTYLHNPSKNRGVVHRAAVPTPMSELVLTLSDARFGTFTDVLHVILVELAQLLLAGWQPHQLAAERLRPDDVGLWDQQRVHGQRPEGTQFSLMKPWNTCKHIFRLIWCLKTVIINNIGTEVILVPIKL